MSLSRSYYHLYRPQRFGDLLGQDHIRQILLSSLLRDRVGHAYLFCGSRGTGKTTTARLLAKAVNCQARLKDGEPCNQCPLCLSISNGSCLDVIEIDAASNRGIDEIRQLQEQIRFQPQQAKRKIFIVDEVHMLTKEAFNALLKTLEEPPAYLMFILATTEAHKLPATILSRCQRFDYQTPDIQSVRQYIQRIAKAEELKIDEAAIDTLAGLAGGSYRDAATLLEQMSADGEPISGQRVSNFFGLPGQQLVDRYLCVLAGDHTLIDQTRQDIGDYLAKGGSPSAFIDNCFLALESKILAGQPVERPAAVLASLVRAKSQMRYSPIASLPLLAALVADEISVGPSSNRPSVSTGHSAAIGPTLAAAPPSTASNSRVTKMVSTLPAKSKPATTPEPAEPTVKVQVAEQVPPAVVPTGEISAIWQELIKRLAASGQSSTVAILRTARPVSWQAPYLTIAVQFPFHAEQLKKVKNRDILETLLGELLGSPVKIELMVEPASDMTNLVEEVFS